MFLDFLDSKEGRRITKVAREETTYNKFYMYWRNNLFERIMRLFIWENTDPIKPKEIEQRLHLQGHCGITRIKNEDDLTAMFGNFYGVTKYQDEFTNYMVRCPIYAGQRTLGTDIVVINNNDLRNPTYELIHHYSMLLAHAEVTFINTLISARDSGGVPVANTEKTKASIEDYQGKLYNGKYGVVADMGMLGVNFVGGDRHTTQNIVDIYLVRERLLKAFYSDIGVRSGFEKRSNTISEEVISDTSLLLLNISDMIKAREKGCEEVNKMYGTNWNVKVANEIEYGIENENKQLEGGNYEMD